MRVVDMVLAFPWILVAMAIAIVAGLGLTTVLAALVIVYSPAVARRPGDRSWRSASGTMSWRRMRSGPPRRQ